MNKHLRIIGINLFIIEFSFYKKVQNKWNREQRKKYWGKIIWKQDKANLEGVTKIFLKK